MTTDVKPSFKQAIECLHELGHPAVSRAPNGSLRHSGGYFACLRDFEKVWAEFAEELAKQNLPASAATTATTGPKAPTHVPGAGSKTSARGDSGPPSFQPPAPAVRATPRVEPAKPLFGLARTEAAFKAETDRKTHPRK